MRDSPADTLFEAYGLPRIVRRIYESGALDRDDDDPFKPNERDERTKPRAARTLPVGALSKRLVPAWLRYRAVSVSVSVPKSVYATGERVPIEITMRNAAPFPIVVETRSPRRWTWHVEGYTDASHVWEKPASEAREFRFDRGERKRFRRTWEQLFRVSNAEWREAAPGEYVIGASIAVDDPVGCGLSDETTIRIE